MNRLAICSVSSELAPFAKTGGLADASAALARYLHKAGHDIRVFLPLYSRIDPRSLTAQSVDFLQDIELDMGPYQLRFSVITAPLPGSDLMVYLVDCPALYDREGIYSARGDEHFRFAFLSRAAIESCQRMGWGPHVMHCHDWHSALIPLYLQSIYEWDKLFANTKTLLTIHNIGYQGVVGSGAIAELGLTGFADRLDSSDLQAGRINFLKTGVIYADAINTVSPTYAREILTDEYGMGLQGLLQARHGTLVGILNGVDYEIWNPATDTYLPYAFDPEHLTGKESNKRHLLDKLDLEYESHRPLVGMVTRLTAQKGIDLLFDTMPRILHDSDLCFVALGSGEPRYEAFLRRLQQAFPRRVCYHNGYHNELAHLIEAAADIFLMPSRYEPCGLNQMYSLKYGAVPVVRKTGGLADSVAQYDPATGQGTGIVFNDYNTAGFEWALRTALELYADRPHWQRIMLNGMTQDFSWDRQGAIYVELYERLIGP